ncbi:MAG: hypothetical protein GY854_25025 [Deltaproteobacteria bacterium]|nr:hypothetical protein [Deltaproteobacteria bacterium]
MKSWQVYDVARKALKNELYDIYGNRNARMINYWAQDPDFSADPKRNPLDRLESLLTHLADAGKRETAISAVRILASRLDCSISDRAEAIPDRPTLMGEIIDDMPCLVAYQKALEGHDLEEVDRTESELQRELAENRVKFIEIHQDK